MKIEIFPSASGDCLLLTSKDGKRLLADAGLPQAYDDFIAEPLSELRTANEKIDVAYVSHIDRDHIGGVLRMLDHEMKWRGFDFSRANGGRLKQPAEPRPPEIGEIWHNAFLEDIERTEKVDLGSVLAQSATTLAGLGAAALGSPQSAAVAAGVEMLALSVGDAIALNWRLGPEQLNIPLNPPASGRLMMARPDRPIPVGSLQITVLGPTAKQLRKLRKAWIDWVKTNQAEIDRLRRAHQRDAERLGPGAAPLELARVAHDLAEAAVEGDLTPPNLASLVLLVEEDGKRVLLTGDAGEESLLEYLEDAGLFDATGQVEFDVLKVPHHGANNAFSPELVRRVRAQHYIFCGDGAHHNPEPDVVAGYLAAVKARPLDGGRDTHFWFNWSSDRAVKHLDLWDKVEGKFTPAVLKRAIRRTSLGKGDTRLTLDLA